MPVTEAEVMQALSRVKDPELGRDVVSLGMIKDLKLQGGQVDFTLELTTPACPVTDQFKEAVHDAVASLPGVTGVTVALAAQVRGASGGGPGPGALVPGVRNIIAVGSGKGGVGKSTVAVNLALALHKTGASVGLLDADIYGPNVPTMMGLDHPVQPSGQGIPVAESYGIKVMSMGFFLAEGQAVVWRGPMIHGAIQQMLRDVEWGDLDYLIVDLPPGTGDASLSLAQLVPLTGAVVVVTPSQVALEDGAKAIAMLSKLNVPILGIVENMSYFLCPHCQQPVDIFGRGGGQKVAQRYGLDFLGELPLDPTVRIGGDDGVPVLIGTPDSPATQSFLAVARTLAGKVSVHNMGRDQAIPITLFSTPKG
ncbi:MAG: Mrp/NBP35 family ATP-binding protein [Chloroflexi bacterium]|nr:Mrp/NBP35 family ATP-binding protein [Chloroflexota bacterium]